MKTDANKPPAFQIYAKDILAGAAQEMTLEAFGAYMILLLKAWDSDPIATLPNNEPALQRTVHATPEEWARIWPQVSLKFPVMPGNDARLYNKRLHKQFLGQKKYANEKSERGKKGAAARWHKEEDNENPFNTEDTE